MAEPDNLLPRPDARTFLDDAQRITNEGLVDELLAAFADDAVAEWIMDGAADTHRGSTRSARPPPNSSTCVTLSDFMWRRPSNARATTRLSSVGEADFEAVQDNSAPKSGHSVTDSSFDTRCTATSTSVRAVHPWLGCGSRQALRKSLPH